MMLHDLASFPYFKMNVIVFQKIYEGFTKIFRDVFGISFLNLSMVFIKPFFEDEFFFAERFRFRLSYCWFVLIVTLARTITRLRWLWWCPFSIINHVLFMPAKDILVFDHNQFLSKADFCDLGETRTFVFADCVQNFDNRLFFILLIFFWDLNVDIKTLSGSKIE